MGPVLCRFRQRTRWVVGWMVASDVPICIRGALKTTDEATGLGSSDPPCEGIAAVRGVYDVGGHTCVWELHAEWEQSPREADRILSAAAIGHHGSDVPGEV